MAYVNEPLGAVPAGGSTAKGGGQQPAPSGQMTSAATGKGGDQLYQTPTERNQTISSPFVSAPDFEQTQPATNSTVGAPALPTTTQQAMPPWKIAAIGGGVLVGALLLGRLVKGR